MSFWKKGQKTELAVNAGIPVAVLSQILHRRRKTIDPGVARSLEEHSAYICVAKVPYEVWRDAAYTHHPAFYKQPKDY